MPVVPERFKVDFSAYKKDLVKAAIARLPSQFVNACILKQYIAAFVDEVQELYDACIDLQEQRTIYNAEGETLDALGRIVGEDRSPVHYDDSSYMFADRPGQTPDASLVYVTGAPMQSFIPATDPEYRSNILLRIVRNHTLAASVPEVSALLGAVTGTTVSFDKIGPYTVNLYIPSNISKTALLILTQALTDERVDHFFRVPYPAPLTIGDVRIYLPPGYFVWDRPGRTWDKSKWAVAATVVDPLT